MQTPPTTTKNSSATRGGERDPDDEIIWLETWHDPTPRPSSMTVREFIDHCAACAERQFSLKPPKSPSREDRIRLRTEEDRKALVIALQTYAKQNNMQPNELEIMEVKEKKMFFDTSTSTSGYVHFNFLVKGSDGMLSLFFAEVQPDCSKEKHVHLCTPVEDTDSGVCFACDDHSKAIIHPTGGGYLGGLRKDINYLMGHDSDSDDDDYYM